MLDKIAYKSSYLDINNNFGSATNFPLPYALAKLEKIGLL